MGIRSKLSNFLKETWDAILSPSPIAPPSHHRAGFGSLHNTLTGTNMPAAYEEKPQEPSVK